MRSYSTLPYMALAVTPGELAKLAADPQVISITENIKLHPALAQSAPLVSAPQAWAAGYQTIATLDTGVDRYRPFLAGDGAGGYESWNETSMAAPHVAGAFALMRQKYPDAPRAGLLAALQSSGKKVTDDRSARSRRHLVRPRVDAAAALAAMSRLAVTTAGSGNGVVTVVTPRAGIGCTGSCAWSIASGKQVKLVALAAQGSRFAGWSGRPCEKARCRFRPTDQQTLTATFIAQ